MDTDKSNKNVSGSSKLTRDEFWKLGMKFVKESDMDKLNELFLCISNKDLLWCIKRLVYSDPDKRIGYGLISYAFASGDCEMMKAIRSLYSKKIKIHVYFLAEAAKFNRYQSFKWLKETTKKLYNNTYGGTQKGYVYCEKHFNIADNGEVFYNACLNDMYLINMIEEVYKCKISSDVVIRCASRGNLELFEWGFEKFKKANQGEMSVNALLGACESGNTKIVNRILHNKKYFNIDYEKALDKSNSSSINKLLKEDMECSLCCE